MLHSWCLIVVNVLLHGNRNNSKRITPAGAQSVWGVARDIISHIAMSVTKYRPQNVLRRAVCRVSILQLLHAATDQKTTLLEEEAPPPPLSLAPTWIWLFPVPGAGSLRGILIVSSQLATTIDRSALVSVRIWRCKKEGHLTMLPAYGNPKTTYTYIHL